MRLHKSQDFAIYDRPHRLHEQLRDGLNGFFDVSREDRTALRGDGVTGA